MIDNILNRKNFSKRSEDAIASIKKTMTNLVSINEEIEDEIQDKERIVSELNNDIVDLDITKARNQRIAEKIHNFLS